ncbi:hypothetical protein AMS68_000926 [Peltaster fructicola]|uniref:Uncharacterized protein n=1 Tax=Peltaster fructicola TaxID=286661 RepID=A0A6H0XLA5_9PEZI|nr:hypothetical protein AMS68_000926 [Peltaster fructicola]
MNKLLNRKKSEPAVQSTPLVTDLSRSLTPSQLSPGLKKSQSRWKKPKRAPEPKQEINLNNVLPSADDFRTSLIMPNLSARFSMLREQDDPNSLLGKAMDDSVLQPSRRSRMLDYGGFGARAGLGDIAEVSSIRSSIRPPFAERSRGDSFIYEDGYDSDSGSMSVMSRARPGEGNVLFGGRQKVYMIPKSGSARSLGKAVYEDDIRTSAFQKHRQREREAAAARMADEAQQFDFGLPNDENSGDDSQNAQPYDAQQELTHSPSLSSYDKKRSTNSSTARSEARSSTAATSVASQPFVSNTVPTGTMQSRPSLERSNTKGRRLYEPGLDQHIHEQQNSALTRLNSIQRSRNASAGARAASPYLHQTKSASNLAEHPSQRSVYTVGSQSPNPDRYLPPLQALTMFGGRDSSPTTSGPASPLSPNNPVFEESSVLSQALEPGDRGKATAMGAFNKPKQPFDEKQYLERQLQLQRSASSVTMKPEPPAQTPFQQRIGRFEQKSNEEAERARSRSKSKGRDARHPAYQGSAAKNPNRSVTPSQLAQLSPQMGSQYSDAHRTFFGNIAASDSEEEDEDKTKNDPFAGQIDPSFANGFGKWQPTALPSVSEHPALRSQRSNIPLVEEEEEEPIETLPASSQPQIEKLSAQRKIDSPTLGENLNGLISHLRNRSNASSTYPSDEQPTSEGAPEMPANARNLHVYSVNNAHLQNVADNDIHSASVYSAHSPWDVVENAGDGQGAVSPLEPETTQYGSRVPNRSAAERDHQGQSQLSQVSGISQESSAGSWQNELRKPQHQRDASTATQQERAAFDNELAARRAAIQDNIKSIVETERSNSPQIPSGPFKALNMLRTKSSRDSVDPKRDAKFRTASAGVSPVLPQERSGQSFESTRPRGNSGSRPPMPSNASHVRALHSEQDVTKREWSERPELKGRSSASSAASQGGRSRSNSIATNGRSRSRTGPYRDDLEKAMVEGAGSSAAGLPDLTSFIPKELTPRPSPEISSSHFDSTGRARSASRGGAQGYFDAKQYQPVQTPISRNVSSPAIPQTLTSAVYAPASARSSPAPSPFMQQTATPPMSGASTPLNASFSASSGSGRPLRKKTISKSDISEPTLVSWTSNIDTVDLPPGASLKNGMADAPPVPPINPKRKTRKIFGRSERSGSIEEQQDNGRSKTPDAWVTFDNILSSDSIQENGRHPAPVGGYDSAPAMSQYVFPSNAVGSPERTRTGTGAQLNGGMF